MRKTYTDLLEALDDIERDIEKLKALNKEIWEAIKHCTYKKACSISQDIEKIGYVLKLEAVDIQLTAKELTQKAKDHIDDK